MVWNLYYYYYYYYYAVICSMEHSEIGLFDV